MSYQSWFNEHEQKHSVIIKKLVKQNFTQAQIIAYFDFDNMLVHEPNFCPLYETQKKCHDMKELNCYLCACPNFRFQDEGIKTVNKLTQFSVCDIDFKEGKQGVYGEAIHQDCSACKVPHHKAYVQQHFDLSWKKIMLKCSL